MPRQANVEHGKRRNRMRLGDSARRLLWFVGLAAASLIVCATAALVFREVIFFVLEH
ncbi:hypothetical protein [Salinisphaera sp. T31B1]|uniref:hypothetical protein n=1 Tax=Salinisphaera sp. T31B1 TaxID=727963 RepID=UPI003341F777